MATRVWKRGVTTNYNYLANGNLDTMTYSDGTPAVAFTWDGAGRNTGRTDAGGTWTLNYAPDGRLKQETTGPTGRNAEWVYDGQGRRQILKSRFSPAVTAPDVEYGYSGEYLSNYIVYSDASGPISSWWYYPTNTLRPHYRDTWVNGDYKLNEYTELDALGKQAAKTTTAYGQWVSYWTEDVYGNPYEEWYQENQYAELTTYQRNALGQLTGRTDDLDAQRWDYGYDSRAQVNVANKKFTESPQQVVAGTQNTYAYDQIGNRTECKEGGTGTLNAGLRTHTYGTGVAGGSANALNQYTTITQPQSFDVTGTRADYYTTMAVNTATPAYQQDTTYGLYWRADVAHNAGVNTRYTPVNVTADSTTTDSWLQYVPPASEPLAYDDDGNLTSDGRWFYKWDGENRLIRMDSVAQTNPTVKSMRLIFTYDGLSRRIRKDVYQDSPVHTNNSTHGTLTKREHYVYEGWNLILTAADNGVGTPGTNSGGNITRRVASYVWGPDIGSRPFGRSSWQEAGGVGGLLVIVDGVNSAITYAGVDYNGAASGNGTAPADPMDDDYLPLMDHLGNVTGLHQLSYGNLTLQGTLDYDAFGREIRSTGPACDKVPFHFSTKFTDPETGLNYYGYRFYDPNNGRWVNRDPIGERGGKNLYTMVGNALISNLDILGLDSSPGGIDGGIGIGEVDQQDWFEQVAKGNGSLKNVTRGGTGKDLLNHLKKLSSSACCIKEFRIAGHAGPHGMGGAGGRKVAGFVDDLYDTTRDRAREGGWLDTPDDLRHEDARDLNDLKAAMEEGSVEFCSGCTIKIYGCNHEKFPSALAKLTGCKVIASMGTSCGPYKDKKGRVTSWGGDFWESNPDGSTSRLGSMFNPDDNFSSSRLISK